MKTISQLLLTFLLNAGWQVALITTAAALCAWLLRGTAARYRHLLWVTALVCSFGLPLLTSWYSLAGSSPGQVQTQVAPQTARLGYIPAAGSIPAEAQTSRFATPRPSGGFVPVGGMWVESDTNLPGSEALARQLVHGKRYFLDGWAGFFAARTQAFYTFLKYAKVLEAHRTDDNPPI